MARRVLTKKEMERLEETFSPQKLLTAKKMAPMGTALTSGTSPYIRPKTPTSAQEVLLNSRKAAKPDIRTFDLSTEAVLEKNPYSHEAKLLNKDRSTSAVLSKTPIVNEQSKAGKLIGGIFDSTVNSIPVVAKTAIQGVKDSTKNIKNQELINAQRAKNQSGVDKYIAAYGINSQKDLDELKEYQKAKEKYEKAVQAIEKEKVSTPMDLNDKNFKAYLKAQQDLTEVTEGIKNPALRTVAQAGVSVAQNAAYLPLNAVVPGASLALMGTNAAAGKITDLTSRGAGANEALARGIGSGAIEAVTEKVPLDSLMDMVKTGGKSALRNILKQAGVEATEEGLSYTLNYMADKAAKDPNAEFSTQELLDSAVQGGLSGLFFGVGGTAVNAINRAGAKTAQETLMESRKRTTENTKKDIVKADYSLFDESILKNLNQARKYFISYAKNVFPKNVVVKSNNMVVDISRGGLDKLLSGNIAKDKYASAFYVPQLLENAEVVGNRKYTKPYGNAKENIDSYTYMTSPINVSGKDYTAYIRIRHANNRNKYYGHTLFGILDDIKIEPSARTDTQSASWPVYAIDDSNINISEGQKNINNTARKNNEVAYENKKLLKQAIEKGTNANENARFRQGLEKFKRGNFSQQEDIVVLDEAPLWLYNKGADWDTPITINMNKLKNVMKEPKGRVNGVNQHGITMDVVEQLPEAIKNPLNVIKPEGYSNRYVAITGLSDQYGDIVIVPIELNARGQIENVYTDINKINSVYGKEDYDYSTKGKPIGYMEYNKNNIVYDIDNDPTKRNGAKSESGETTRSSSYRFQPMESPLSKSINSIGENTDTVNRDYIQNGPINTEQKATNSGIDRFNETEENNLSSAKGIVDGKDMNFISFIKKAKDIKNNIRFYFGKVSNALGESIRKSTGLDVSGYNIAMRSSEVVHALEKHGNSEQEAKRGQISVTPEALEKIPEVFNDPDEIVLLNKKDYAGRTAFEMRKQLENYNIVVVGVANGRHSIEIDSFRIQKKKPSNTVNVANKPLNLTSETGTEQVSNNSIPQNTENINKKATNGGSEILFNQSFGKNTVGSAENNPQSVRRQLDDLAEKNGAMPEGEKAARVSNLPVKDRKGKSVSRYARTIIEDAGVTDQTAADVEEAVLKGEMSHETKADKEAADFAKNYIKDNGFNAAYDLWENAVKNQSYTKDTLALGQKLLTETSDIGERELTNKIAAELVQAFSTAGQNLQAARLLKRMTPDGMVTWAETELAKIREEMRQNGATQKTIDKIDFSQEDLKNIRKLTEEANELPEGREKTVKYAEIKKIIDNKVPPKQGDRIKALGRIAMLFNLKTQVRNVLGNALIMPNAAINDVIGTAIDKRVSKKTGQRTTALPEASALKGMAEGAKEAWEDFRKGINTRDVNGNRFEVGRSNAFTGNNPISKGLNALDRTTSFLLDFGDRGFFNTWYRNSLQQQMRANGVQAATQEMKDIARQEALNRTWQDTNGYTEFVSGFRNALNKINIKGYGLGDMALPFIKTPANLTKAMVDYSPAGVINAITKEAKNLNTAIKTGEGVAKAQRRYVDALSKGITGTLMMSIMAALVKNGILTGEQDKDKDVADFEKKIMGIMPYSVKIGDKSFSYEWAMPLGGTMAMVADGIKAYNNTAQDEDSATAQRIANGVFEALKSAGKVLFNQSFAQGIAGLFNDGDIIGGILDVIAGEPAKFTPSVIGQIAQFTDGNARSSYVYGNETQSAINQVKAKVPGLRETLPKSIDVLGNEVQQNSSFTDVFLNPANYYTDVSDDVAKEIYELYKETGDKSLIPPKAPYYVNYKNEKTILSPQEKEDYQKTTGDIIHKGIQDILLEQMSMEEKTEYIGDLYSYANAKAKEKYVDGYEIPKTAEKIDTLKDGGLSTAQAILMKQTLSQFEGEGASEEKRQALLESDYTPQQKKLIDEMYIGKDSKVDYTDENSFIISQMSEAAQKEWSEFKALGWDAERFERAYNVVNGKGKKEAKLAELQKMGYSYNQAVQIWSRIKNTGAYKNK